MIERVVENWLTSANERQYQLPFCQLLAAEGETVLHISAHGQMEQGKDVISRGVDGGVRAYQLKNGNLKQGDWRRYESEIGELVVYPIEHPSVGRHRGHRPFLVTNGKVADTVVNSIRSMNRVWGRLRAKPLELIAGPALVKRFIRAHGEFLPREPRDFTKFLELVVNSGTSPLDKKSFSSFLESLLQLSRPTRARPRDVRRAIASAVLFTTYIVQGSERMQNHWAVFEAWTMMAAYAVAVSGRNGTAEYWWGPSFDLCVLGAQRALEGLSVECSANQSKFTQGDPFTDGHVYRARISVLAGLLGAASLSSTIRKVDWEQREFVRQFLLTYAQETRVWGESAVPYLVLAALTLEKHGNHAVAEGLVANVARSVAGVNGKKGRGLPSPYYGPEEALRIAFGMDELNNEVFAGHCYTLEPMVQFLARRWLRQHLARLWEIVTGVHYARFQVERDWEVFRWRAESGSLVTTMPRAPQSWQQLLTESESAASLTAHCFRRRPEFSLYFVLVYPHRFTPDMLKVVENAVA